VVATSIKSEPRRRVPAAERRDALIEAAVHHFAHGGLQGTKVSQIAADVGVAQPYVFSLFPTKRDLFLAAVGRCFAKISALFEAAAAAYEQNGPQEPEEDKLKAIGHAYMGAIADNPDQLLLQLQAYAACGDDTEIQTFVRHEYAQLIQLIRKISGVTDDEELDGFFQAGMWCNVAAALGVEDFSVSSGWVEGALAADPPADPH
jgi:AcrR family transcriptional regulator